jgi:SAM-dependent methyltransferase
MHTWIDCGLPLLLLLVAIGLFFFLLTRGTLLWRQLTPAAHGETAHVYPLYSNPLLIRLVDFQPVISAILLWQYRSIVSQVVLELQRMDLRHRQVLITSCAFGNVIPRVVKAAMQSGTERVLITDLIDYELTHARDKLGELARNVSLQRGNATAMEQHDGTVGANIMFFLLHELPHPQKALALNEAIRVLAPGGKLMLAEFHRPDHWPLRVLSWTYFKVFEPLGLALWDIHDPFRHLQAMQGITCERTTFLSGNFQVITATRS